MRFTKSVFEAIKSPRYTLYKKAHRFIKSYEGYSYNFKRNGEEKLLDRLSKFDFGTVFDVGANVGDWTNIALSKFPNAHVHSFELSEETFLSFQKNHKDSSRVHPNNIGLSNESGEITYNDYGANSGVNTIVKEASFHDRRKVPTEKSAKVICGDVYCDQHNIEAIDFLKIDVEGAENLVLQGFNQKLSESKIKIIQFEYGYTNSDAKFLVKDFYNYLTPFGYVLGPLKPSGVLFMDFDYALNNFNSGPNYVAVHGSQKKIIDSIMGAAIKGFPRR